VRLVALLGKEAVAGTTAVGQEVKAEATEAPPAVAHAVVPQHPVAADTLAADAR